MARQTTIINVANTGGTSDPSLFTLGSYAYMATEEGPNTITIDTFGTWSQTGGLLVFFQPGQVPPSSFPTGPFQTIPQNQLVAKSNGNTNGLVSGVTDGFVLSVNGAGTLYVVSGATTWTGICQITLGQAASSPAPNAAGDSVVVTNTVAVTGTVGVTGTVAVTGPVTVTGTVGVTGPVTVSGTVSTGKPNSLLGQSLFNVASGLYATGGHTVEQVIADNSSSTTLYLMVFDAATLPSNGTVPVVELTVPFGVPTSPTESSMLFTPDWVAVSTGVFFAWSTTPGTLTVLTSSATGLLVRVYGN